MTNRRPFAILKNVPHGTKYGGIAQLGERLNGIQEVSGSIPLISTKGYAKRLVFVRKQAFSLSVMKSAYPCQLERGPEERHPYERPGFMVRREVHNRCDLDARLGGSDIRAKSNGGQAQYMENVKNDGRSPILAQIRLQLYMAGYKIQETGILGGYRMNASACVLTRAA